MKYPISIAIDIPQNITESFIEENIRRVRDFMVCEFDTYYVIEEHTLSDMKVVTEIFALLGLTPKVMELSAAQLNDLYCHGQHRDPFKEEKDFEDWYNTGSKMICDTFFAVSLLDFLVRERIGIRSLEITPSEK